MPKKTAEPVEQVYRSRKRLMIDNFIGGISWGIGSVLGATLIVAVIVFLLSQAEGLPFIGDIAKTVTAEIEKARQ